MRRGSRWAGLLAIVAWAPGMAVASEAGAAAGTLSLVLENDLFADVDRHYTSGVRGVWVPAPGAAPPAWAVAVARLLPWFPEGGEVRQAYAFGQSMFTPDDITLANPPPHDRPYAGWLYGSIGLAAESGRQLDQFALTVGVVGPASLAKQSQKIVHRAIDSRDPKGWDSQLHDEPGLLLTYQRSWREFATSTFSGQRLDLTPHLGATLGNVFSYGNAGLTVRYGKQLPADYGPPRIQPSLPGSGHFSPPAAFRWYGFAGIEGRIVGRNIFLDGNSFRASRSVDKRLLVGDLQFGVVMDWPDVRLSYTHVLRSREFRSQDRSDVFGAISVSFRF